MGEKVRPHFAHKNLSQNCTPETVLHFGFKRLLYERILKSLISGERLPIQWDCEACSGSHAGNLLKRAVHAEEEYSLGVCKPDICLLSRKGEVVAAIEIVVTHSPEHSAIEFYKKEGIPLIIFLLKSDAEMRRVEDEILKPSEVSVCLNPKCLKCNEHMSRLKLLIIDGICWRCHSRMTVGALEGDAGCECAFTAEHIDIANIQRRYSKTVRARYAANTCKRCNAFIGHHCLFADYVAREDYPRTELNASYYCPSCVQRDGY